MGEAVQRPYTCWQCGLVFAKGEDYHTHSYAAQVLPNGYKSNQTNLAYADVNLNPYHEVTPVSNKSAPKYIPSSLPQSPLTKRAVNREESRNKGDATTKNASAPAGEQHLPFTELNDSESAYAIALSALKMSTAFIAFNLREMRLTPESRPRNNCDMTTYQKTLECKTENVITRFRGTSSDNVAIEAIVQIAEEQINDVLIRRGIRYDDCGGDIKRIREWEKDAKALRKWRIKWPNALHPKEGTPQYRAWDRETTLIEPLLKNKIRYIVETINQWREEADQKE